MTTQPVPIVYRSISQNAVASLMIGLGPGIYGALTGLGAGGGTTADIKMQNVVNSVLYVVFFFGGLVSGSVVTTIGPRNSLMIGSLGYPIYAGSLWYYTRYGNYGFPIFAGAFLGISGCLLWTATGYIASSYSVEGKKGAFISMQFWVLGIFSTIAALIAFAINFHASVVRCPDAVYIVFICMSSSSLLLALAFIRAPTRIVCSDGSHAVVEATQCNHWSVQLRTQKALFKDWRMLVLATPFFAGELGLAVMSTINAAYFNIRTRTLNTVAFNIFQIVGAIFIRFLLDSQRIGERRARGITSVSFLSVVVIGCWSGLIGWLQGHPLSLNETPDPRLLFDWTDGPFGGYFVLTLLAGVILAIYQTVGLWIAAALTNDPPTLAGYAGWGKGWLAGGLAVSFGIEASGISQLRVVAFCFAFQAVGLICMYVVCGVCVKATSETSIDIPRTMIETQEKETGVLKSEVKESHDEVA